MIKLERSKGFDLLDGNYLFTEVREKTSKFLKENGGEVINLGVGDVAFPLPEIVVNAFVEAGMELGDNMRFRGYPTENGYDFLKKAISDAYVDIGVGIACDEIFIGDGAKTDTASFLTVMGECDVVICEPVYPVYLDSARLLGKRTVLVKGTRENGFMPTPGGLEMKPYAIWLCSPNNPTGSTFTKQALEQWVSFALKTGSLILFDSAYSFFVKDGVRSIYEVEGADSCAVEISSFSKFAGFTNLRCSHTVVPKKLSVGGESLNGMWKRRQSVFFNGVSYPVQRAAEAALSQKGREQCRAIAKRYMANTCVLGDFLRKKGIWFTGGESSPYIWLECPGGKSSGEFFDFLLATTRIVGTPGAGFGCSGEGYFRFSCFATEDKVAEAVRRMDAVL